MSFQLGCSVEILRSMRVNDRSGWVTLCEPRPAEEIAESRLCMSAQQLESRLCTSA